MRAISSLINEFNVSAGGVSDELAFEIGRWITRIVRIFGLDGTADYKDGGIGWSGVEIPTEAKESVYAVSEKRDQIRQHAIAGDLTNELVTSIVSKKLAAQQPAAATPYAEVASSFDEKLKELAEKKANAKEYLQLCDRLRDLDLFDLGIYLEDRTNQPALVRPVDAELRAERAQKEAIAKQKAEAKEKREREEAEKRAKLAAQAKIDPKAMFKTEEYSAWDADGLPTKDKDGADVPKTKTKKLTKEWQKQKKLHEEYLKGIGSSA
jgi:cysteinyl-tRNA synthetase